MPEHGVLPFFIFAMSGMFVFALFTSSIILYVERRSRVAVLLFMAAVATLFGWALYYLAPLVPGGTEFQRYALSITLVLGNLYIVFAAAWIVIGPPRAEGEPSAESSRHPWAPRGIEPPVRPR